MKYTLMTLLALCLFSSFALARPTLRGPGGLINMPTAYLSSGGTVAPQSLDNDSSEIVSSLNYSWKKTGELALQKPGKGETGISLKYQLTEDVNNKKDATPATAIGFLDMANENSKAFYGVMSAKAAESPLVLHMGLISEGSMMGKIRFMGGFETPLSKQMMLLGEYDGMKRDINSGFLYHVSQNIGSFIYLMDIKESGLQSEVVSGFTFKMAF